MCQGEVCQAPARTTCLGGWCCSLMASKEMGQMSSGPTVRQPSALLVSFPGNNRKALKLSTRVSLAPTSSLRAQGLLSGEGAAVENTKGNRHGSAKLREQRFYTSSFASGASSSLRAGSGLDPQGLLSWHWEPRHLVMQHRVYQVHSDS